MKSKVARLRKRPGALTSNPNLMAKGRDEKNADRTQNKVGQVERVFGGNR